MKNRTLIYMLLLAMIPSVTLCTAQMSEKLSPETFTDRINSEEKGGYIILDVRTEEEIAQEGKIPGAQSLSFFDDSFSEKLSLLDRNMTYYIYCASGGRSGKTQSKMSAMGFKKLYDLEGGMKAWKAKGLPIE